MKGTGQAGQGVPRSGCLVVLLHFCCSGLGTAARMLGTGSAQILTGRALGEHRWDQRCCWAPLQDFW